MNVMLLFEKRVLTLVGFLPKTIYDFLIYRTVRHISLWNISQRTTPWYWTARETSAGQRYKGL